jgi:hypothetical protein
MQTYRRFASTASSTSRSASSSMHTHTHAHAHQPYTHSTLSRSSSTASAVSPSAMTPVDNNGNVNVNVNTLNNSFSRISSMSSIRNSSYGTSSLTPPHCPRMWLTPSPLPFAQYLHPQAQLLIILELNLRRLPNPSSLMSISVHTISPPPQSQALTSDSP